MRCCPALPLRFGVRWVTADALEEQRRITAQLQAEAESLAAEKEAQGDPRYFLQLFEEMIEANENQTEEDQEKQTAHQMTVAHAVSPALQGPVPTRALCSRGFTCCTIAAAPFLPSILE